MICPKCNQDTLTEYHSITDDMHMVICSNCSFSTTRLEYHAWEEIRNKKPPRKIFLSGKFRGEPEWGDFSEVYEKLTEFWNTIRTPTLIMVFLIMLTILVLVTRE